jgi:uncharacterized membrane protein
LTTLGLGAVIAGRERIGSAGLGVAIMAKVYPVVFLPIVLIYLWRRGGVRAASGAAASTVAGAALVSLPFLIIAPLGMWSSLLDFTNRPLQVESTGAAILWAAHNVAGMPVNVLASFGSDNLVGSLPTVIVALMSMVLVVALAGIWLRFAREPRPNRDHLVLAATAAVCAFVLFGKVLSGQYLIWLIPLVALLRGPRGVAAAAILGAALVLTQQWYPARYPAWVYGLDDSVAWIVLLRDVTIGALFVTLAAPASWAAVAREWLGRSLGRPAIPSVRPVALGGSVAVRPAFMRLERGASKE